MYSWDNIVEILDFRNLSTGYKAIFEEIDIKGIDILM